MSYLVGVDTGGTFTDIAVVDDDGAVCFDKAFSTPDHPEQGVLDALQNAAARLGVPLAQLLERTGRFAHGTTVSTNALLQRRGARVGLLTTAGFEDTLRIARGPVGRTGGLSYLRARDFIHTEPPPPLVPWELVRGVSERIAADGAVLVALDRGEVARLLRELLAAGAESLAVCLLWSFRNDAHERAVAEVAAQVAPGLPVSLSCEVAPLLGEFERSVTTVVNAYVAPGTSTYIAALQGRLSAGGLRCPVQVMKSSGGLCLADQVARQAVAVVNSGPVGGLVAARYLGRLMGEDHLLTTDVGGTSFDVGLVAGGHVEREGQPFLAQGLPVHLQALKVVTIGAGGGSIARTDGRRLLVGPDSAGAEPGPACYGRGGRRPTVTDALVVLGILDPEGFFAGRRRLDADRAAEAVEAHVGRPLDLPLHEAAAGIFEIVTARMSDLMRNVTIESGHDPRRFVVLSYGGAGPAHAALFSRALGVREVVVPAAASVFSALGMALSDIAFSYARSEPVALLDEAEAATVFTAVFGALQRRAAADLAASGCQGEDVVAVHRLDLRYAGQMNELSMLWDGPALGPGGLAEVRRRFAGLYEQRFGPGTAHPEAPFEVITFRLEVTVATPVPQPRALPPAAAPAPPPAGERRIYLRPHGWLRSAVYDGARLEPGHRVAGPALITREDTTILVPPDSGARVDEFGSIRIAPGTEAGQG